MANVVRNALPVVLSEGVATARNATPVYLAAEGAAVMVRDAQPVFVVETPGDALTFRDAIPVVLAAEGAAVTARDALPVYFVDGPPGPSGPFPGAAEVLDFEAGYYRVENGTEYTTAADAGWTGTGTFDASGYTATGTQVLSKALALTGDFIVFAEFAQPAPGTDNILWTYPSAANLQVFRSSGGLYRTNPSIVDDASALRAAFGRAGGARKICWDNGAVTTGAALAAQAAATFYIGNLAGGTNPWNAAIKRIVIYKATLSDAEIQALGT